MSWISSKKIGSLTKIVHISSKIGLRKEKKVINQAVFTDRFVRKYLKTMKNFHFESLLHN
jgi:hypothetical protein